MRTWAKSFLIMVYIGGWLGATGQSVLAYDFSDWDALVKKYVAPKTIAEVQLNAVKYQALANDPLYPKLIHDLEGASLSTMKTREETLAFWINVYNIMAVKMVVDHYPVTSIKDAGSLFTSVWKKTVGTVAGKERTLNEIEHEILRKMGEPRIHVAIVCASVSCPDLRVEAYSPERLNEQLDDQMKKFVANTQKGLRIDQSKKRLYLSSIFKWFEEDFEPKGGVRSYLALYVRKNEAASLKNQTFSISYLDYNWELNEL